MRSTTLYRAMASGTGGAAVVVTPDGPRVTVKALICCDGEWGVRLTDHKTGEIMEGDYSNIVAAMRSFDYGYRAGLPIWTPEEE